MKYKIDDLVVDTDSRCVYRAGEERCLSFTEYELLMYLLKHQNKVISRSELLENVFTNSKAGYANDTNIVDVYIAYVRREVERGSDNKLIHTVRNVGYMCQDKSSVKI